MTWYLQWSDSIKKRACRYLLQRYLGQYLEEKLTLDQLSVDIYCGTGSVSDVSLDVQALNDLGEHKNLPFEFVDGFISNIAVSIPWANLFKDSIFVEVTGMQITIQPKQRPDSAGSMLESMWSSMASSIQIAAECLKHESPVPEGKENEGASNMEGLEIFASAIESILKRVKIKLLDTCVRLEHLPKDGKNGIAVEVKLNNVEYCDETTNDWNVENEIPDSVASEKSLYSIKKFHCSGISFYTDEFPVECRTFSRSMVLDETNSNRSCDKIKDPLEPILIGKLSGYQEIRIKIKLDPSAQGPKVDLELNLGSFTFFLSPRQLCLLIEIMESLASPHTQDSTNVVSKKNVGEKLMSSRDFKKVEQDLQETLNFPAGFQIPQPNQSRGWSSPCLEDGEDEFLPMKLNNMTGSCASVATNDTSYVSNISGGFSSKGDGGSIYESSVMGHHSKKFDKSLYESEPEEETSAFHVRLSSLALVILHEDILTFGVDSYELTLSSVSTMRNLSSEFFDKLGKFTLTGNKDFEASKEGFMKCCRLNHLRLLAATIFIEGNDNRNDSSSAILSTSVSAASLELLECLVEGNSSSNGEPQYVELLKFMKNNSKEFPIEPHYPITQKPDLRMHFTRVKKHYHSKVIIKLDVSLQIEQCWTEVDLSILDRIATIINFQTLCRLNPAAKNTIDHNVSFSQAVENAKHSDRTITFRVKSPFIAVKFRFPIPDLRPPYEKGRYPWWQRSVRKDVLFINLVDASFHTDSSCEMAVVEYRLSCRDLTVLFQEGNTELPIPFIYATCDSSEGNPPLNNAYNSENMPRLLLRLCSAQLIGEPEDFPEKEDSGLTCSTYMESPNSEPSPFMSKKVVHETDTHHHAASDGEELVIPGSEEDIEKFISHAVEDARVQVDISLPFLCVEFPTKHLYEVIYNRINSDLSLYQTKFPKTFEKDYSYLHPVFSLCKSGLQIESDESDDESPESRKLIRNVSSHSQSNFSLNISVSKGVLDIFTNLKDPKNILIPDKFGEMYFDLKNAHLFLVSNYKGKPQRNYVCLQVRTVEMFHKAIVENRVSGRHSRNPPSYLEPVLLKSHNEIVVTSMSPEGHEGNMLTVAVSTEVSERRVKTIRVACSINQVTLRHRVSMTNQSWLTQLMDFFDVIDYPVKGYDSPQVITELHVHTWDSAIDYRPLYSPISCVITLGNLSISSNIAARTKTSTLRFIAEEASLFITDKMKNQVGTPNLQADYISVIQLGLFELSLRLSEQPNLPKIDLKASNNMLNIRTCSDSAAALAQLITYYASDGDLTGGPLAEENASEDDKPVNEEKKAEEEENREHERENLMNQSCLLTESAVGRVNDMMEDAMQEIANNPENSADCHEVNEDNDVFYFPDEGNGFVSSPIDWGYTSDSDFDFCVLELDTGIAASVPETGRPEVRRLSDKPIEIIENHFNVAVNKSDQLLSPKFYPTPVSRYRLTNMAIIWHMYGGCDFSTKCPKKNVKFSRDRVFENPTEENKGPSENHRKPGKPLPRRPAESIYHGKHPNYSRSAKSMNWQVVGGPYREHNVLMQLQVNKVKFQHEIYPEKSPQASRQVLLIHEFEIRDRLATSQINKFLYQYTSETNPKQSHANMMTIKAVHLRPDSRQNVQETCLKVSILPLRLNIDQDSLQFLVNFFIKLSESSINKEDDVKSGVSHCNPVMGIDEKENESVGDENERDNQKKRRSKSNRSNVNTRSPMFIRNFIFSPEVPIRIDYEGKRVDLATYGPLKGLLIGLGQLNCLQIKLKRLSYKHGLLGIDKLVSFAINEWLQDIKKTQVPCLIGAVGPMHALVQLFQGIRDLFWLPIEQYQKDGRIVRGIQRGANSFTTSTAIAALELTARIVQAIQSIAEAAFDMVSPGPSVRRINGGKSRKQHNYSHPADIREGVANAYTLVKEGLGETAETLVRVASAEAEQKGAVGAVGGVLRQIPPTVVAPIILASAATTNLLGGVRSQLAPDSRREATYKWKKNVDESKPVRHGK